MPILTSTVRFLDRSSALTGRATSWFAGLMVAVTCYIVVSRYAFNSGSVAVQELLTYCNALLFTLGAAYTLQEDAHVRVDVFYGHASARARAWVNLLGVLLMLFPFCIFILWSCWGYVEASWAIREKSGDTGGLPWVYLLKTLILVMAILLAMQGVAEGLRSLMVLLGVEPAEPAQHHDEHAL